MTGKKKQTRYPGGRLMENVHFPTKTDRAF